MVHASSTASCRAGPLFQSPAAGRRRGGRGFLWREGHAHKRGEDDKVVVFGMLERGGELRARPIDGLKDARREIVANVEPKANLMTDEWPGYRGLDGRYHHHTVNHGAGEYVKNFYAHVNGIEGVWSLIKRQIYGIHHWVSAKHLHRYLAEAVWRYNRRQVEDGDRIAEFLGRINGRLTYAELTGER